MNNKEIISHIINTTDWNMMVALRTVACEAKGMEGFLNTKENLVAIAEDLLESLLGNDECESVSSAMLCAYRVKHSEALTEVALRFEAETAEATAWLEDGKLSLEEDSDEWDDVLV